MEKPIVKKIITVVLGMALLVMLYSFVSFIIEAVLIVDVSSAAILEDAQFMYVALICLLFITFVSYGFAYFGNGKIFNIFAAVLSLLVAACSIAFLFVLRGEALEKGTSTYALVAGCFAEFIQLAVPALIACAYFIYSSVKSFKHPKQPVAAEAVESGEAE